jgi:hypothetical protein
MDGLAACRRGDGDRRVGRGTIGVAQGTAAWVWRQRGQQGGAEHGAQMDGTAPAFHHRYLC